MKPPVFAYLLLPLIFLGSPAFAQRAYAKKPSCFQGSPEKMQLHQRITAFPKKASAEAQNFIEAYQRETQLQNIIRDAKIRYKKNFGIPPTTPEENFGKAIERWCPLHSSAIEVLSGYLRNIAGEITLPQISNKCVVASLKRENDTKGWTCESETSRARQTGSAGKEGPCITAQVADYLTWATNKAIACLNDPERPIDPLLIYKKINNETGFSFFSAYDGGVGIGQLTSSAIDQINKNTDLVEKVRNSTNPACAPFKKAMARKPDSPSTYCAWLDPSEGVARNLIYSIGYFLNSRDVLTTEMHSQFKTLGILDARYFSLGALATYGKGGLNNQDAIIEAAKQSPQNYEGFEKVATNTSLYIHQVQTKYHEALTNAGYDPETTECVKNPKNWGEN